MVYFNVALQLTVGLVLQIKKTIFCCCFAIHCWFSVAVSKHIFTVALLFTVGSVLL
jgi:hypothetical protein